MCTLPSTWPSHERRVDRLADVVDGDDLLDVAGLPVDDHHLRRVAEHRVDRRVRDGRVAELLRPVDDVLALVVDTDLAAAGHRRGARVAAPSRPPSACRVTRWSDRSRARGWCRRSRRCAPGRRRVPARRPAAPRCARPGPSRSSRGAPRCDPAVADRSEEAHDRLGHLAEPVAEARVLQARARARRPGPPRAPRRTTP